MKTYFSSKLEPQNQSPRWRKVKTSLSLMLLGGGLALGGNYLFSTPRLDASIPATSNQTELNSNSSQQIASIPAPTNFVIDVVNKVGPAVVRIDSARTVETRLPEAFNDPFFRRFFGSQLEQIPETQVERGTGSGFIVSADGIILTNSHVVDGADSVSVVLKDGRTFQGKVMGIDSITDMGVVKIEAENLPTVTFGDSDNLQIGEWAIAIGNPLGLDNTVTTGIVSATGRSSSQIGVGDKRIDFIQTDAAINPGNSGGPLLNANGEVIGINTAIIQRAQGLGFAIPINTARNIAEQLIAKGRVDHPFLGIRMASLTPEVKQQLKTTQNLDLGDREGVLIIEVLPNSPAAQAGLRGGDVITMINNQPIKSADQVQQTVEKTQVGASLPLTLYRQDQTMNLNVQVGLLPSDALANK
ncbi:HtrA2 peptidase [Stanieria cyanosphaera PCC 7437]|uniref:HtrA2 peptidase n=1 Tax=Stanieria cyanosphaera (strain ATCC 29371 / PCC 7437) TaxID=111780 RepID=K9XT39_STAC7|nr:HhoA/HhoB/HtrA family serine endopeptidase [Stanieria cyanosphaera]AFZ35229.1 HtrA2 peptidase [Stanieria cyanosphaera PCC 7437]